ncbi:E3 ubiquitin-protein ligase RNF167-like [Heteronotia binoei]|uniref:E3 ubiquitin-protein ligase RNF167-like n=1 Tax=Heteronotia binoei TaxID=13085 RepID=UPI0029306A40|nr:E3 ubiquitin-protein ligase RNF167-like [Heteronotia binoei]
MCAVFSFPFHLVMMLLLFHVSTKEALIRAVYNHNGISQDFKAMASDFGPVLYHEGLLGYLIVARPANACYPLKPPPFSNDSSDAFIALIQRYNCSFTAKVLHAQQAGYHAAIIHNVRSQTLVIMTSENEDKRQAVTIPSLFISESSATQLKRVFRYDPTAYLILIPEYHWLFCSDTTGYSCQSHPQKSRLSTPKQNLSCVPGQSHFVHEAHYLLFGLMLMVWIAALYSLCCW